MCLFQFFSVGQVKISQHDQRCNHCQRPGIEGKIRKVETKLNTEITSKQTPNEFAVWFDKYAKLGLNLRITEADFFDVKSISAANETKKANILLMYYRAGKILDDNNGRKVLDSIVVWGSTNNSSWLNDIGRTGEFPLLLDDNGNPYLSWYLIGKALFVE